MTQLLDVKPHAFLDDIGSTIKSIPVTDIVVEVDLVAIYMKVSIDWEHIDIVLYFLYFFFISKFSSSD